MIDVPHGKVTVGVEVSGELPGSEPRREPPQALSNIFSTKQDINTIAKLSRNLQEEAARRMRDECSFLSADNALLYQNFDVSELPGSQLS